MKRLRWVLAVLAMSAFADNYPRQTGVDVQHYVFGIVLSDSTDEITGEAIVEMRFVSDGVTQVVLDLTSVREGKGMTVAAVTCDAGLVRYSHESDRLTLTLPAAPRAGERRRFTIAYHGVARDGLHIGKNKFGERTFFSWNWPVLGRQWLPMIDHPYDKATSEFLITAPARYQVVANGHLEEEIDLGNGWRRTHWKESVPIASWLNNIGVARFAARHFATAAGVPLSTWVFPSDRENGIRTFEEPMRQAIEFFSDYIGPYPYEKLGGVQVSGLSGGMEHASAVFYGERSVTDKPAFSLVAHEVSHQWWGDSVTERDWDDAWLSEGFATYFAALAAEHYEGRDAFVATMKRSRSSILQMQKRTPDIAVVHENLREIQNGRAPVGIVYQKGGWTLHMLRGVIGSDKFRAGIREYYRRYRDANASTDDLRGVMEEAAGEDLSWFFRQWLARAGSPVIAGTWSYNPGTQRISVDLTQMQPGDIYRLPMDIGISTAGSPLRLERIDMNTKIQHFEMPSEKEPVSLELDPHTWVLLEATLVKK